jgi:hydrogenase expression/formation protein HypE
MTEPIDLSGWNCPLPLRDYPNIVMGHGGGGKLSAELVEHLFLPAFADATLNRLGDSAQLELGDALSDGARLAFSTDSFVVKPLFFPAGTSATWPSTGRSTTSR